MQLSPLKDETAILSVYNSGLVNFEWGGWFIKDTHIVFLIPQDSTGSSLLLVLNESPYCSHYYPKFPGQIHFGSYNRKCTHFWYTNFDFLICIFITASPRCHILIFAPGEQIRSNLEVKLPKTYFKGQGQSVESEKKNTCQFNPFELIDWLHCHS